METKVCSKCKRELLATTEFFNKDKLRHDGLFPYCKECRGHKFKAIVVASEGNKICPKCNRELPASIEYFHRDKNSPTGCCTYCRECRGYEFLKITPDGYKYCISCEQLLSITEEHFYKRGDSPNGFGGICKDCHHKNYLKDYHNKWDEYQLRNNEYTKIHKERISKYQIEYRNLNHVKLSKWAKTYNIKYRIENRETLSNNSKMYYQEHKEKILKRNSEHYQIPHIKEHHREIVRAWHKGNPDKVQLYKLKRRTLLKNLPSTLTPIDWNKCKEYFNFECAYCGKKEKLTLDHYIPVSKNGGLSINNSIPACRSCNSSKGAKLAGEWFHKQSFYSKTREQVIIDYLNRNYYGTQMSFNIENSINATT